MSNILIVTLETLHLEKLMLIRLSGHMSRSSVQRLWNLNEPRFKTVCNIVVMQSAQQILLLREQPLFTATPQKMIIFLKMK